MAEGKQPIPKVTQRTFRIELGKESSEVAMWISACTVIVLVALLLVGGGLGGCYLQGYWHAETEKIKGFNPEPEKAEQ